MCCPVAPPECGPAAVAAVPAKIDERREREQRRAPPRPSCDRPARLRAVGARARARQASAAAATRISIERPKCAITKPGASLSLDREAAEHRLRDDAERQRQREQREVAAERPPPPREDRDGHGDARRRSRTTTRLENSISACVCSGGIDVAVAARPVRAAEARAR